MRGSRVLLLACSIWIAGTAGAADIVRRPNPGFPIATSVSVPAGAELLFVSGKLADVAQPNLPARTTVQVASLPVPGALVEIEVIAARK